MAVDRSRVACFGGLHVDVTATAAAPIRRHTSNPVTASTQTGGVAANVARVLARFGHTVVMCSAVGSDAAGPALVDALASEGVQASGVVRVEGATTARYTAVVDADGSLFVGLADMAVYEGLDAEWVASALAAAESCGIWMLDANLPSGVIQAVVDAAGDRDVVADPVSVLKARRLEGVLGGLTAVFPDGGELVALTGAEDRRNAAAELCARGPVVVASFGADGVVVADAAGVRERPAVALGRVVDETGAGDALLAGYLHGVLRGEDDPVSWGLAAAAITVGERGSVPHTLQPDAVAGVVQGV